MQRVVKVVFLAMAVGILSLTRSPIHAQSTVIGADNAAALEPVAWLSQGNLADVAWAGNGKTVAFFTSRGIWLYDTNDFDQQPRHLDNPITSYVRTVNYDPSGLLLYARGYDGKLNAWDTSTGRLQTEIDTGFAEIQAFTFSTDNNFLAVAGRGQRNVALIDAKSHKILDSFAEEFANDYKSDIVFTPDNKYLIVIPQYRPIRIWMVANGKLEQLRELSPQHQIQHLAISRDGKLLLLGGQSAIEVWDFAEGKLIGQLPTHIIPDNPPFRFSPDGKTLAVASGGERLIQLWDTSGAFSTWHVRSTFRIAEEGSPLTGVITAFAFSPDSQKLMVTKGGKATLWDVNTGSLIRSVGSFIEIERIFAAQFTPDGEQILLHVRTAGGDAVAGWDAKTLQPTQQIPLPRRAESVFRVQPHGTKFVVLRWDFKSVYLVDRDTGQSIRPYAANEEIVAVDFSPDGQKLFLIGNQPVIYSYDIDEGTVYSRTLKLDSIGKKVRMWNGALNPYDGQFALHVTSDNKDFNRIVFWNYKTGLSSLMIDQAGMLPTTFTYSPDGDLIAAVELSYLVGVYDLASGKRIMQTTNGKAKVTQIAFNQDQSILAVATDQSVQLWDVSAERMIREIEGGGVVAFSPDGTRMLLASSGGFAMSDGAVTLWEIR